MTESDSLHSASDRIPLLLFTTNLKFLPQTNPKFSSIGVNIETIAKMSLPVVNPQNASARPPLLSNDSIIPYKPTKPSVPTQPLYIPRNPTEPQTKASSLSILRTTDNASFLATLIPSTVCRDVKATTYTTRLADCIIPVAALPLSRICNHKNIISLIDIVRTTHVEGDISSPNRTADLTIWEDMTAGSLSYVLPLPNTYPALDDELSWHALAAPSFQRFGLPEGLVWHVLRSIARALLWLHHGVKETPGIPGDWSAVDPDWQAILIADVSPGQIWFKHPRGEETYGECKLGGFGRARVAGSVGARAAMAPRDEGTPFVRRFFWAPVCVL